MTNDDVKIASNIFGPDVSTIKSKTPRRKPLPVIDDYIEIPCVLVQNQQNVTLAINGITVNSLQFLITISRNLYYRRGHYIPARNMEFYKIAIDSIVTVYNQVGFTIKCIHCDNEFRPLVNFAASKHHITMNYANLQEHVPEVERNNRVINERCRATFHRLPFTYLTKILVKYMVTEAAKKLNFFPAKYGVSNYYSPRMILHQQNLDYEKHCKFALGTYVQGYNEPLRKNTSSERSLDCIYLRYHASKQGGRELLKQNCKIYFKSLLFISLKSDTEVD